MSWQGGAVADMVEDAIRKVETLVEAMDYIRAFRNRLLIIKLGGSCLEDEATLDATLQDVVFLETVGMKPVLIHGGGKAISAAMRQSGLEPRFVQGRRYTDEATLQIVGDVLTHEINADIVRRIEKFGAWGLGLHQGTQCVLTGQRMRVDENGQPLDLGFVGRVTAIDEDRLHKLTHAGIIPVLPSLALTPGGQLLNINADTAAAAVARLLRAEKLVFISDIPGILRDETDENSLVSSINAQECQQLIDTGVIRDGMIPKVQACLECLNAGVRKIHLIDGRIRHSLLLEIYTKHGIGTEIVRENADDLADPFS